ncbi:AbiJ-NTD4 domain-containing protein [Acinetobacter bouvetii]|uniref:HEPN AbiJ-N-terminal domain-containing protein n=1 Tax=Acinetobacter bouvetii TaxID=202951 RepID=A0A811G5G5_9GAMM|nr:hypothetical protein [Acinetobacter bouvetii]CAB1207441.1 hypothetical protein SFB21_0139 [Acinetobacter bouvetii]
MRFSEKYGYKPVREVILKEKTSDELLNKIWNIITLYIFNKYEKSSNSIEIGLLNNSNLNNFFGSLYHYQKKRIDQMPIYIIEAIDELDVIFFNEYEWYEIYDFLEFCLDAYPFQDIKNHFIAEINRILEEENTAYRIIENKVIEITSEQEIQSIEEALANTNPYSGVQQHLNQALKLMSDRQNPDYRNSIKESISAVESICKIITNDEKATLGKALKIVEDKFGLHPALKGSLSQLYGYTSDGDGIRHAMLEESNLTYIDAKFMLVACTNFINYLIEKTK